MNTISTKRERNVKEEEYIQPILTQLYKLLGYQVKRITKTEDQLRGADIQLSKQGVTIIADEKGDFGERQLYIGQTNDSEDDFGNKDSEITFCQEKSFLYQGENQPIVRINGWNHEEARARALNSHYIFVWMYKERDPETEELTRVRLMEVMLISCDAIDEIIHNAWKRDGLEYPGDKAFIEAVLKKIKDKGWENQDITNVEYHPGVKVCYLGASYEEKPINFNVYKAYLRKYAVWDYACVCRGETGKEKIVALRQLGRNVPDEEYKAGFIPVAEFKR